MNQKSDLQNGSTSENAYSYYSNILKQPFETLESLKNAEKEYLDKQNIIKTEKAERKNAAQKVDEALTDFANLRNEVYSKLKELEKNYIKEQNDIRNSFIKNKSALLDKLEESEVRCKQYLTEFVEKYGSFHTTITDSNKNTFTVSSSKNNYNFIEELLNFSPFLQIL